MTLRATHPYLRLALSAILLAVLALGALPAGVTMAAAHGQPQPIQPGPTPDGPAAPQDGGSPLAQFLNPDGTLNLPAEGIPGSIDPAGFQMVSAPGQGPRFAAGSGADTRAPGDENWAESFDLPGMNNFVYALAWDGTNLYVGGRFTTAGGVSANYIASWNGSAWSPLGSGMNYIVRPWRGTGRTSMQGARSPLPGA